MRGPKAGRGEDRQGAAQARADEDGRLLPVRGHLAIELLEHSCQRQRREIRLVEVGALERDAVLPQPFAEVRRLRRFRRGCESVEVEDRTAPSEQRLALRHGTGT